MAIFTGKKMAMQLLKLIGVFLFVWIVSRIDLKQALVHLKQANMPLLIASFFVQFFIYAAKTLRWHALVRIAKLNPTFSESWHLYNIGIFLATVTPGKLGEIGRAAYLQKAGMHTGTAISLVIFDRLADVVMIAAIAVASAGILFGDEWAAIIGIFAPIIGILMFFAWRKLSGIGRRVNWLEFVETVAKPQTFLTLGFFTLLSWILYFVWAVMVAKSIGIEVAVPTLVAVFTITGILALFPIAPSGLGTRDAALVALLAPYGVSAAQAVSLGFIMFVSIVLSGALGMYYWLTKDVKMAGKSSSL